MHNLVFIGDVSGNKASITTSGQLKVDATVNATANISGQPVQISGQTVVANVVTNISGQTVAVSNVGSITALPVISVSGNMVSISGQPVVATVTTNISGQTIYTVSGQNAVQISGQTVTIANAVSTGVSGQTIYTVSGQNNVQMSGQTVVTSVSGNMVSISGQPVTGSFAASVSGQPVLISGQTVVASVTTNISGQVVYLVSGQNDVQISGQRVLTSVSGNVVRMSGEAVSISGQIIRILDDGLANMVYVRDTNGRILNLLAATTSDNESTGLDPLVTVGFNYGFDANAGGWARLKVTTSGDGHKLNVSISGQPITGSFSASVSGQPVLISGQTVIANVQSTTNISGQVVYLVNDGVNNVVQISGQTLVIPFTSISGNRVTVSGNMVSVSGQPVLISGQTVAISNIVSTGVSGQTVYFANDGLNNVVKASGETVYLVSGKNDVQISGQRVLTSISGNMVSISGQPVTGSFAASVSGQPVLISGQTVVASVTTNISGQTVSITDSVGTLLLAGNTMIEDVATTDDVLFTGSLAHGYDKGANVWSRLKVTTSGDGNKLIVSISGQPVTASVQAGPTNISGQVVYLVDNGVNNVAKISGQTVYISGQDVTIMNTVSVLFTDDGANNVVKVSGQAVRVSGSHVSVSGIVTVNALPVISVSGNAISVSGNMVSTSGQPSNVSGSTVSVSGVVSITGPVSVSGGITVSGNAVRVSGESIRDTIPTVIRTRALLSCTALSGGTQLLSGDVRKMTLVNAGSAGTVMYIGSTTDPPFSGGGLYLIAGNGLTIETNNFNNVRAFGATSGIMVSYIGEQY